MLKKSIFSKIFGFVILVAIITGGAITAITIRQQTQALEKTLVQEHKFLVQVIAQNIESGYKIQQFPFELLKLISDTESVLFLWIVKPNGEVFFADDPEMFNRVIKDPFLGIEEVKVRDAVYPKTREKIKLIAGPIKEELVQKPWTLFLGVSLRTITRAQNQIIFINIGLFILSIIFISFISFYFSKGITKPLEKLRNGAEIIGKGNFEHRIKIKTGDEIEELAKSFNLMAERLKRSREALEDVKIALQIQVKARTRQLAEQAEVLRKENERKTKALRERLEELERFHRLTVGRELKMMELKEKIKKMEVQLKEANLKLKKYEKRRS
jgi:HAMP domain-containing protein